MKTCFKCRAARPLSEFYVHKMMADGRLNKCKPCARADVTENRKKRIDHYRQYDLIRYREDGYRAQIANTRSPRSGERQPQKQSARRKAKWAVDTGKLKRPDNCQACGKLCKPHAHHHDYSKPLDVQWLCPACHGLEHRRPIDQAAIDTFRAKRAKKAAF